jgi:hypothetical protein
LHAFSPRQTASHISGRRGRELDLRYLGKQNAEIKIISQLRLEEVNIIEIRCKYPAGQSIKAGRHIGKKEYLA